MRAQAGHVPNTMPFRRCRFRQVGCSAFSEWLPSRITRSLREKRSGYSGHSFDSRLVGNPSLRPLTSVLNVNAERHRDEDHLQHRAGNRRVMFENPNIIVSVYAPSRISYCKC